MAIERRAEVHKLTISGLPAGTEYGQFLIDLRSEFPSPQALNIAIGAKTRYLDEVDRFGSDLILRVLGFQPGSRPDVIDTTSFEVVPNPLAVGFAPVEYTHAVGSSKGERYLLLIEMNPAGASPEQLEYYLQRLIKASRRFNPGTHHRITVNLEPVPSLEFIEEVDKLDQIKSAMIRVVQPDPGWKDNEDALSGLASESDAKGTEVKMVSRWGDTLSRANGIMSVIRDKLIGSSGKWFAGTPGQISIRRRNYPCRGESPSVS